MKTRISRAGGMALLGILLAIVLLGLICSLFELKMYKEIQYTNEINGFIIEEIVDNLVIEVQTDIYLTDTIEPAFRTFTPIRWQ